MLDSRNNIALIGMPGAGKSTLGMQLAELTARDFLDLDFWIQEAEGTPLPEIVQRDGIEGFRRIEERCATKLDCSNCVIATGGSVVYSDRAMEHLRNIALLVYLETPLAELQQRLGDLDARAVLRAPGQGLEGLLAERGPLYERWAEVRVNCAGLKPDAAIDAIVAALPSR